MVMKETSKYARFHSTVYPENQRWLLNCSLQVGEQWIVTASHCVEAGGDGQFTAIAGSVHRIDFSVHQQV